MFYFFYIFLSILYIIRLPNQNLFFSFLLFNSIFGGFFFILVILLYYIYIIKYVLFLKDILMFQHII